MCLLDQLSQIFALNFLASSAILPELMLIYRQSVLVSYYAHCGHLITASFLLSANQNCASSSCAHLDQYVREPSGCCQ
jgi:hypothetical protein